MSETASHVVNADDVQEVDCTRGECWGGYDQLLTPSMRPKGGRLGVSLSRVPKGRTMYPFHYHEHEDEVFFVLSGRGVLGTAMTCASSAPATHVSCPAGTKVAHQIANPFDEDLRYLAIGPHDPREVCVYPDTGKVLIRSLGALGFLNPAGYHEREPDPPEIFGLAERLERSR